MAVTVSASKMSVILKASGHTGVAVAAFPDVCKTPTPGGPIPIPYPSMAGASQVKSVSKDASGKVVMTKDGSYQTSTGDEAGSAMGGVASSKVKGKAEYMNYSFDVKMEGANVARSLDPFAHNDKNTPKSVPPASAAPKSTVAAQASQARIGQLRFRLHAITSQLSALRGGDPNPWHKLVDEYVLVTTELYLELTPK
jgi:Domain of unknown function (DUF4150)